MSIKEILLEKHSAMASNYYEKNMEFFANPAIAKIDPFKVADDLYYVGDKKVCVHLIDAGVGLILIDSGYLGAAHLLVDSIWRMGFDPKDVKWIIHTHGHSDHFGASREFKSMFGTKLAISRIDAESLREKPHRAHINTELYPNEKIPKFDYEIEDGEIFEFGNKKLRCVLTPGHTAGVLSLFFDVNYLDKTYLAGLFGGAGVNALTLPYICYNEDPEDCPQQMLDSIEKIIDEPVAVHLGNHPYNNKTLEKREEQINCGGNPFINYDSWKLFLEELKGKTEKIIIDNRELKQSLQ